MWSYVDLNNREQSDVRLSCKIGNIFDTSEHYKHRYKIAVETNNELSKNVCVVVRNLP